jgi:hypothetical protein
MGVGKDSAREYNSSSDEEGDEDKGESIGESKGFVFRRGWGVASKTTPLG